MIMKEFLMILCASYFSMSFAQTTNDTITKDTTEVKSFYYVDGKSVLAEIGNYLSDGKQIGIWKSYYENGQLKSIGNYSNGKKEGVWKWYHENGKLSQTGSYDSSGSPAGKWIEYDKKGEVTNDPTWSINN